MRTPKLKVIALAVGLALGGNAPGADFLETFRLAKQNDPQFAA